MVHKTTNQDGLTSAEPPVRHYNQYTLLVSIGLSLSFLAYGYTGAVIGTVGGQPSFLQYMNLITASNATQLFGATNGLYYAGGVFGTIYASYAADRWGRKNASVQAQVGLVIAQAIQTGSVHIAMFIVGRFIAGFASVSSPETFILGISVCSGYITLCVTPMWLSELVPPRQRGTLMQIIAITLGLGYVAANWIGYGFSFYTGKVLAFRPILGTVYTSSTTKKETPADHHIHSPALGMVVPVICIILFIWLPESPRWLIMKDRHPEAHALLRRLHRSPVDKDDSFADVEYYQISRQAAVDANLDLSWKSMISTRPMTLRTAFGIVWPAMTATSGVNVVVNYGPLLYSLLGFSSDKQLIYQGGWATLNWGGNVIGIFIIDRFNRPGYSITGFVGVTCCLLVEAIIVATSLDNGTDSVLRLGVASIFLFGAFFGCFIDGLLFTWVGEVFPTPYRAKGYTIALATQALFNIIWTEAAPTAFANIKWGYYIVFIVLNAISVVVIWLFFPNTRGLALEEVGAIFGDGDRIAVYQRDIDLSTLQTEVAVIDKEHGFSGKELRVEAQHIEATEEKTSG
ncbi:hypothetical protein AYO21_08968 [Fonsecaea monophora]|uniref:Major facilitator superfamily (MFS) profile domain-containing protein n=1 Tax=Fonsecaea monophora TaxID=254056 RepID=A0A177EXN4_9EURO|nr:hypothetical protein AYO21_08968 [Fonsecaea monophora]OAG36795.1 hypothetical protein AYO21_08968 [Fonsecaea monophora]